MVKLKFLNSCLLPSFVVTSLYFGKRSSPYGVLGRFLDLSYSPYISRFKCYAMALERFQSVFGYVLASWSYNEAFIIKRNKEKSCSFSCERDGAPWFPLRWTTSDVTIIT